MYLLICFYICMYWKFTKKHSACICMYLSVSICICLYMTESTCITRLNTVQIDSFIASTPRAATGSRVVCGPNHGPRVDVEQLAARSRRKSGVQTHSLDKTSKYNINMYKYTHIQTYTYTYAHSHLAIFLSGRPGPACVIQFL